MSLEYKEKLNSESLLTLRNWKQLFNSAYSNLMVEEDFLKDKNDLAYCHYRAAQEYNRINVNKTVGDALTFMAVSHFQTFANSEISDELQSFKESMFDYVCEEVPCNHKTLNNFIKRILEVKVNDNLLSFEESLKFTKVIKACYEFINCYLLDLEE